MNLVALLGLPVIVFASTNIDDIFVLLGFLADPHFRLRNVAIDQYIGIGALVVVSVVASLISLILAAEYVGLLGILPVLIGVTKLFAPLKVDGSEEGPRREARGGSIAPSPVGRHRDDGEWWRQHRHLLTAVCDAVPVRDDHYRDRVRYPDGLVDRHCSCAGQPPRI